MTDADDLSAALTRALFEQASLQIPDETVSRVSGSAIEAIAALRAPAAIAGVVAVSTGGALAAPLRVDAVRRVITALSASLILGGGAAIAYALSQPGAQAQTHQAGSIEFVGGSGVDGHFDPISAQVTGIDFDYATVSWRVLDSGSAVVLEGSDAEPSVSLADWVRVAAPGSYTVVFEFRGEEGATITKERVFVLT
jgi:hypothetical protein